MLFKFMLLLLTTALAVGGKLHTNSCVLRILLKPSHMQLRYYLCSLASSSIFYLHKSQTLCRVARILSHTRDFDQVTLFLSSLCLVN